MYCTGTVRHKFEKAVLARIENVKTGRDGASRVVEVCYFKAQDCRMVGKKLSGKPTRLIRGLEPLSQLNQASLDPCKVRDFLQHHCNTEQDQAPEPPEEQQPANEDKRENTEDEPSTVKDSISNSGILSKIVENR